MWLEDPRSLRLSLATLGFLVQSVGSASDKRDVNLAERLMNNGSCLLNRVTVVVKEGVVAPRGMASVVLARLEIVDRRTATIVLSGRSSSGPISLRLTEVDGRYYGLIDTMKGPITLLECDRLHEN